MEKLGRNWPTERFPLARCQMMIARCTFGHLGERLSQSKGLEATEATDGRAYFQTVFGVGAVFSML